MRVGHASTRAERQRNGATTEGRGLQGLLHPTKPAHSGPAQALPSRAAPALFARPRSPAVRSRAGVRSMARASVFYKRVVVETAYRTGRIAQKPPPMHALRGESRCVVPGRPQSRPGRCRPPPRREQGLLYPPPPTLASPSHDVPAATRRASGSQADRPSVGRDTHHRPGDPPRPGADDHCYSHPRSRIPQPNPRRVRAELPA